MKPFFIFGLPRSRTAWLSTWLTHNDRVCRHDALSQQPSVTRFVIMGQPGNGFVETAGSMFVRTIYNNFRDAKFAIVRRPETEVVASLYRCGLHDVSYSVRESSRSLREATDYLISRTSVFQIGFDELDNVERLGALWTHLRGDEHDEERTRQMVDFRIVKINPFWNALPEDFVREEETLRRKGK